MRSRGRPVLLCVLTLLCPTVAWAQLHAAPYVTGLNLPVEFVQDPSDPTVQYVVEQAGVIRVIKSGALQATPFLDLTTRVAAGGERGLLGLAFPSNYASSGRFFVYYTRQPLGDPNADGGIVVARYKRSVGNPLVADPSLFKNLVFGGALDYIPHATFGNHNGGHLAFGPDGYLYVGVGDGGGGNDPFNSGQSFNTYLGKILRLDVSVVDADPVGFTVPASNPFVAGAPDPAQVSHATWALGLRNPWKFSFDEGAGSTGALVIGDVGQNAWEEIDRVPAIDGRNAGRGVNFGWPRLEGTHSFSGNASASSEEPVAEYSHADGACSVVGGYVYRGQAIRGLRGMYVFTDYCTGKLRALAPDDGDDSYSGVDLGITTASVSSFGERRDGELFVLTQGAGLFRLVAA